MCIPLLVSGFFGQAVAGPEALALLLLCSGPFQLSTPIWVPVLLSLVGATVVFPACSVNKAAMNTLLCIFPCSCTLISLGCSAVSEVSVVVSVSPSCLVSCGIEMCAWGSMISP